MAKRYFSDLQQRVAAALSNGEAYRSIATRFEIAPLTAVKWSRHLRETGNPAPANLGGFRSFILKPHRAVVLKRIETIDRVQMALLRSAADASRQIGRSRVAAHLAAGIRKAEARARCAMVGRPGG